LKEIYGDSLISRVNNPGEAGRQVFAKCHILPKRFVSIRSKDIQRELTEEQRQEVAERFRRSREINSTRKRELYF